MHPEICAFTSELFYESRLHSRPGLELQEIRSNGRVSGSGLRFIPVAHEGNQSSCPEEAEKIRELVAEILSSKTTWVDREGKEATIGLDDILIIAPYNAQVFELQERIPRGRIGTVDKFQSGSADRHLFDDDVQPRRCAARHGVSLQLEPAERGDFSCTMRLRAGRVALGVRSRMPHASTDATRQRVLPVFGNGDCHSISRPLDRTIFKLQQSVTSANERPDFERRPV